MSVTMCDNNVTTKKAFFLEWEKFFCVFTYLFLVRGLFAADSG